MTLKALSGMKQRKAWRAFKETLELMLGEDGEPCRCACSCLLRRHGHERSQA